MLEKVHLSKFGRIASLLLVISFMGLLLSIIVFQSSSSSLMLEYGTSSYPCSYQSASKTTMRLLDQTIEEQIINLMEGDDIPSIAAAILHNDSIAWLKGFGEQPGNDTVYMIASITKTFTATALLQLYEQGLFDLDDDVNEYLPFSLRNPNYPDTPITFRMLLSHTSSINGSQDRYNNVTLQDLIRQLEWGNESYSSYPSWLEEYLSPSGSLYTPEVWCSWEPGSSNRFSYTNPGFDVLGYLVELLSSKTLEQYFTDHIFIPLDMMNTGFNHTNFTEETLADGYYWNTTAGIIEKYPRYDCYGYGAYALRSTVEDLSHFLLAQMNGGAYKSVRVLEEETVELMHDSSTTGTYGLGWIIRRLQGHSGHVNGFLSSMFYKYPQANRDFPIGVILLMNQDSYPDYTHSNVKHDIIYNKLFMEAEKFGHEPSEPLNVVVKQENGQIILEWSIPLNEGNSPITHYIIYRGNSTDNLVFLKMIPSSQLQYNNSSIEPEEFYYYTVSAVNGFGEGNKSGIIGPIVISGTSTSTVKGINGYSRMTMIGSTGLLAIAIAIQRRKKRR
ncbi:MAG: serine hydrolase [Candidatus Hodarchaeales archaeon]|jgi:CubicO group peptidase (beta-lactamase class C family)